MKPVGFAPKVAPAKPLTEEEKKIKVMQFLQQKRETIAVNVLCNLVHGAITNKDATNVQVENLVEVAVNAADKMIEKLYPMTEDKPAE